jgi:hypothetical protein
MGRALNHLPVRLVAVLLVALTFGVLSAAAWLASEDGLAFLNRARIPELVLYGAIPLLLWTLPAAIVALTAFLVVDYVRDRNRRR